MRVVAGTAGGRRLLGPPSTATRPTTDKVREAIFNSLFSLDVVDDARVVDLFAGTGACGIEALSRGAAECTFVDKDRKALDVVRTNLVNTGFDGNIVGADVLTFLDRADAYDLAFVDPPYAFDDWASLLQKLRARVVVCESDRSVPVTDGWQLVRERRYGGTVVATMQREKEDE